MRFIKFLVFLLITINISLIVNAQQVNTLYFMKDVPVRHFLNPSFQPVSDFYISLPVIGFTQFSIGNNSLSLKDIIFNENGKTVSFLNTLENQNLFYSTLKSNTVFQADFQTNLISVGFRHESSYLTFSITEKIDGMLNMPKDIFNIALFGTPNPQNNSFDFKKLEGGLSMYTEAALGYSKQIDNDLTVGAKIKMLVGQANLSNSNNHFSLEAGAEKWTLNGLGKANYSGPVQLNIANNFQSFSTTSPANILGWLNPSGIGAGIDFGFEYRLNKKIQLSGAINDLGFIRWSQNVQNDNYGIDYTFRGVELFNSNSTINSFQEVYNQLILKNSLVDTISNAFNVSKISKLTNNSYTTVTTAKINLGFEYSIIKDKVSLGILSYSRLFKNKLSEEITGSINARPLNWLNVSLSYSMINGRLSTFGAGLGLKTGIFHWIVAADYLPFEKTTLTLSDFGVANSKIKIPIPYNSNSFNLAVGLNIVFNKKVRENRGLMHSNEKQDCNCNWK